MTKKINWKARAAENYHLLLADAGKLKDSGDASSAPLAFMKIGGAQALQGLLLEYGVDLEAESKSKIVLLS